MNDHVTQKQSNVNPSPLVLENGTVIIVYCDADGGEQIGLARADDATKGPCERHAPPFFLALPFLELIRQTPGPADTKLGPPSKPIFQHHCEDPFLYKGRSGYHVICHDMEHAAEGNGCRFQGYDPKLGPPKNINCTGQVGLHAYAKTIEGVSLSLGSFQALIDAL